MLSVAAYVLGLTCLVGLLLFALYGRITAFQRLWLPGAGHGALGLVGATLMVGGLRSEVRPAAFGASSFGTAAAVLIAGALLTGLTMLARRFRLYGPSPSLVGVHATLAVAGLVMLAAYLNAGNSSR